MRQHGQPQLDDWFQTKDYVCVSSFGAREWAISLLTRFMYKEGREEVLSSDLNIFWKEYVDRTRPNNIQSLFEHKDYDWMSSASVAVQEIPVGDILSPEDDIFADISLNMKTMTNIRIDMIWFSKKMLLIDLEAPDTILQKRFEEWLQKSRITSPLPIKRRGPKATNVQITKEHFKSWTDYKILACFDIDYWTRVFNLPRVSHERFCEIFDPHYAGNSKDWGRASRKKMEAALDSVSVLQFQI